MIRLDRNELPFLLPQSPRERVISAIACFDFERYLDPGFNELLSIRNSFVRRMNALLALAALILSFCGNYRSFPI